MLYHFIRKELSKRVEEAALAIIYLNQEISEGN